MFLDAIKQRKTMVAVMHEIVLKQDSFNSDKNIKSNDFKRYCKPLNIDISTVSRICNGKYVQLPWGIYEMRSFLVKVLK